MARTFAHLAGLGITIASLAYLVYLAATQRDAFRDFAPSSLDYALLASGCAAYAAAGILLALAWRDILIWTGERNVGRQDSLRIYGRTQIAKYIPGNVAQFAGRQIAGRMEGWSHLGLALSSLYELLSLLYVGAALALAGFGFAGVQSGQGLVAITALAGLTLFAVTFPAVSSSLIRASRPQWAGRLRNCRIGGLWPAALRYVAFFLIGGLLLLFAARIVAHDAVTLDRVPALIALFATAWFVGVVTPGAPSGIGVREALLVAGLGDAMPAGDAIIVAGLVRAMTIGGDVLFYAGSIWPSEARMK